MSLDNIDEVLKVIVVGDGSVGKTSLLRRFCKGEFSDQYKKTIGAEFLEKDVFVRSTGATLRLNLWDTAGQEVFNAITAAYYRGAGACVLAFSTVDRDSFFNVQSWKQKVEAQCGPIPMLLCQTKCDLLNVATVSEQETQGLATQLQLPLFLTSTKDNTNVAQLFEFLAERAVGTQAQQQQAAPQRGMPTVATNPAPGQAGAMPPAQPPQPVGQAFAAPAAGGKPGDNDALKVKLDKNPPAKKPKEKKPRTCMMV